MRLQIPEVSRVGMVDLGLCVPDDWTDEQIVAFAEANHPAHMQPGWTVAKEGSPYLAGCAARIPCPDKQDFVHVRVDV